MKWLILLVLLAIPVVSADSITIDGKTFSILDFSMKENTATFQRSLDSTSPELLNNLVKGQKYKEVKVETKQEIYLEGVFINEIKISSNEDIPSEVITISFEKIRNKEDVTEVMDKSCDVKICNYMKNSMGMTVGADASMIPFSDATINVQKFSNESVSYLVIKDKKIVSFDCCMGSSKPTHILRVKDLKTFEDINSAEDKTDAFKQKMNAGDVSLKATGFFGKIGLFFGKLAMNMGLI